MDIPTTIGLGGAADELETVHPKWMPFKDARQMPALIQVLDHHALTA